MNRDSEHRGIATTALRCAAWTGASAIVALAVVACAQGEAQIGPPDIRYGETVCVECQMIISDPRYASAYAHEIAPGRYEPVPFDDIGDMLAHAERHPEHSIVAWYVHDYGSQEWIDATAAHFVFSSELKTPMAQGTAAFAEKADAQAMASDIHGEVLDWAGLRDRHAAGALTTRGAGHGHGE